MESFDNIEWVARFIGGPYDGAEVVIVAVADFVAVKRVRDGSRRRLAVIANPSPTPPDYELYRLDDFDEDTATYVYGPLDFGDGDGDASTTANRREAVMA